MTRTSSGQGRGDRNSVPGDLTIDIRMALKTLADVEARYRGECEALARWSGPDAAKKHFADQIDEQHATERGPLVQRLARLHQQTTMASMFRNQNSRH